MLVGWQRNRQADRHSKDNPPRASHVEERYCFSANKNQLAAVGFPRIGSDAQVFRGESHFKMDRNRDQWGSKEKVLRNSALMMVYSLEIL